MFTLLAGGPYVTTNLAAADPSTSTFAPGAFLVMGVVILLLGWSFRTLSRTFSDLVAMFRVLANVALTAVLLLGTLAAVVAWVFVAAAKT
jgi:hypothetical protein